jgi:hypothetical protein
MEAALRSYSQTRDYNSSAQHDLDSSMGIIEVSRACTTVASAPVQADPAPSPRSRLTLVHSLIRYLRSQEQNMLSTG